MSAGTQGRTFISYSRDVASGAETVRLELDAPVTALVAIAPNRLVVGDGVGRLHWLEIVD